MQGDKPLLYNNHYETLLSIYSKILEMFIYEPLFIENTL